MILTKEAILKSDDLKGESLTIKEWGGDINVGILSGTDLDKFQKVLKELSGKGISENLPDKLARLAILVISDEKGKRLFTDADIPALMAKSFPAMQRVMEKALEVNQMTEEAAAELSGESASGQS